MQHLTIKATTTDVDTELGTFTAVVSAWDADRDGDVIEHTAFNRTIAAWRGSGKRLPLLFEHSTKSVGAIDPATMHPSDAGLVVSGEVDRETDEGRQVWRMIKQNTIGFSIGFMSKSKPRKGGGSILTEVDLLEVSATSTPMHPSARVLDWKSSTSATQSEASALAGIFDQLLLARGSGAGTVAGTVPGPSAGSRRDAELRELAAELEASEAKRKVEAKRKRPIRIARFEV